VTKIAAPLQYAISNSESDTLSINATRSDGYDDKSRKEIK